MNEGRLLEMEICSPLPLTPHQIGDWIMLGSNFCMVPSPLPLPNIDTIIDLAVMPTPEVAYSNVLKFFITLGSASAMASSSPILVHWYSSKSRLVEWRISTSNMIVNTIMPKLQDLVLSQHQVSSHCRAPCKEQSQQPAFTLSSYLFLTTVLALCSAEIT